MCPFGRLSAFPAMQPHIHSSTFENTRKHFPGSTTQLFWLRSVNIRYGACLEQSHLTGSFWFPSAPVWSLTNRVPRVIDIMGLKACGPVDCLPTGQVFGNDTVDGDFLGGLCGRFEVHWQTQLPESCSAPATSLDVPGTFGGSFRDRNDPGWWQADPRVSCCDGPVGREDH